MPVLDPALLEVWRYLVSTRDDGAAARFFEQHVVNGAHIVDWIHAHDATGETLTPTMKRLGESRPNTQVNLAKHLEILGRKWLVTGYVLVVREPSHQVRRVPLNYRRIRIGTASPQQDIVLDLGPGQQYQAVLELQEGHFVLFHESGDVPTMLNGHAVTSAFVGDGDTIGVGAVELCFFKLLERPAELHVVNGPDAGKQFAVDISEVRLGRPGKRINDINLPSSTVSREHGRVIVHEKRFWLIPEATSSPTAINGVPVEEARCLNDNDQIVMGELTLLFRVRGGAPPPTALEARVATVLFFDLRGWTTIAESTPLQDFITQVNEYYNAMGEIIHRYGGTLMTYQGDGIMAVFGAPAKHSDDPWRAVAAVLRMLREMDTLSTRWVAEGKSELRGGIGIHTGQVVVGELGHSSRLEYSAVGDATNLAARLEQLTKEMGHPIIISEATYKEIETLVEARCLGPVTVKGRSTPTEIYEVLSLKN